MHDNKLSQTIEAAINIDDMHSITTAIILSALSALSVTANPVVARCNTPYFEVRNFTFSKSDSSSRYQLYIDFPRSVVISDKDTSTTIPGFDKSIPCTGTYFTSSEPSKITPINACGALEASNANVTTKLDVGSGDLYMTYTYAATVNGKEKAYVYTGKQVGLGPVRFAAKEGFNTTAKGPGVAS